MLYSRLQMKKNGELSALVTELNTEVRTITTARDNVLHEKAELASNLNIEKQSSEQVLAQKDELIVEKDKQIERALSLSKAKASKVAKTSEMETRIRELLALQESNRQQYHSELQKCKDRCASMQERITSLLDDKKRLEGEIKSWNEKLREIKKHSQYEEYLDVCRKLEKTTAITESQNILLSKKDEDIKKLKNTIEELSVKVKESAEKQYTLGTNPTLSPTKLKKKSEYTVSDDQFRKILNESPHTVDAYKEMLRDKESQIKELTLKLRSALVARKSFPKEEGALSLSTAVSTHASPTTSPQLRGFKHHPAQSTSSLDFSPSHPVEWVSSQIDKIKLIKNGNFEFSLDGTDEIEELELTDDKTNFLGGLKMPSLSNKMLLKSDNKLYRK